MPVQAIERGGPPKDGIPAIDRPLFVSARAAQLNDEDRVLGIVSGGTARAYPVRILNWHEVVNDRFERSRDRRHLLPAVRYRHGVRVARARRQRTGFGVSGLLYNSDVLLYDRATESLWSQILPRRQRPDEGQPAAVRCR